MNEAKGTWALVVGINRYDCPKVRNLKGAVADAVAAVRWLEKLGVPSEHIISHLVPSGEADEARVDTISSERLDARKETIDKSIAHLERVEGPRLFVFLCGHGLYEPLGERLFLTQEAGMRDVWMNLGLNRYFKLFQAMRFRRQFLIMDGCLNYPYSETRRPMIEAQGYPARSDPTPDRNNYFTACFAASEGEVAREVGERGVFMKSFLTKVNPEDPWPDALDPDERDGSWTLDVRKVVLEGVAPLVKEIAPRQNPCVEPRGAAQRESRSAIYRIPSSSASHIGSVIEDELVRLLSSALRKVEDPAAAERIEKLRIPSRRETGAIDWEELARDVIATEKLEALMTSLDENCVNIEQWRTEKARALNLDTRRQKFLSQSHSKKPGGVTALPGERTQQMGAYDQRLMRLPVAWACDTSVLIDSLSEFVARASSQLTDDYSRNSSLLAEVARRQPGVQARLERLSTWLGERGSDNKDDWLRDLRYALQKTSYALPRFEKCCVGVVSQSDKRSARRNALEEYSACAEELMDSLVLVRDAIDPHSVTTR